MTDNDVKRLTHTGEAAMTTQELVERLRTFNIPACAAIEQLGGMDAWQRRQKGYPDASA